MKIQDYFLTVQLECDCGCSFILVGQVGQERPCPDCPRFVRLDGFSWDEEAKQIRLKLSWGKDEPTPVPVNVGDFIPETPGPAVAPRNDIDPDGPYGEE